MTVLQIGLAAVMVCVSAPVFAQSDELLQQEADRLMGKIGSRTSVHDNYRWRPYASSHELEVQMDHIDKMMEEDDIRRYTEIQEELGRRASARSQGERQAQLDAYRTSAAGSRKQFDEWMSASQQRLTQDRARLHQQQRESAARHRVAAERGRTASERDIALLQNLKNESAQRTKEAWRLDPIQPGSVVPSCLMPKDDYNAHRD